MGTVGRVEAIWIKRVRGGPMDAVPRARAMAGSGLDGSADQGGLRQITVIEREVFERLREQLSPAVEPVHRRANLMVSGVRLAGTRDRTLRVGRVRVAVRGETRPCHLMDEAVPGLRDALRHDWNGGVFGEILDDGEIAVGDDVAWVA